MRNTANKCEYKEKDKHLACFINGIIDDMMTAEIIKEVTTMR